jgi:parvulin-like peptidyl-prolyl isomerase
LFYYGYPGTMRYGIVSFLSLFFICAWSACSVNTGPDQGVVIRVGERSITGEDFARIVNFTSLENDLPVSVVWASINSLVNKIVDDSLILEYGKSKGIHLDESELEGAIQDITRDYPEESFKETLLMRSIDYNEWKQELREQLLIRKIVRKRAESIGPISYEAIRSYYEQRPGKFSHPPRVKFVHMVANTRGDAEALLSRLRDGDDIEMVIKGYAPGRDIQVDRGTTWHTRDMLPQALSEAAFSMPVGGVSPIIQTPYGFHVIKVLQRELAGRKDLLEVMGEIEETLLTKNRERNYTQWLASLRKDYPITVNYTILDKIRMMNEDH